MSNCCSKCNRCFHNRTEDEGYGYVICLDCNEIVKRYAPL